ncbi:MAG TPA: ComEA family DNA-binding protein [Candidatus Hypogeohydataceae bacterium YC41]
MEWKTRFDRVLETLDISTKEFLVLCILFSTLFAGILVKYFLDNHIGFKDIEILRQNPQELHLQLDINHAEWYELMALPQIGEKRARAIVEYRQNYGPFSGTEDLLKIKGINPGVLEEIRRYIKVGDIEEKEAWQNSN